MAKLNYWDGSAWNLISDSAEWDNQLVDPRRFGAIGDGVTDDTAAISAAIASIHSGGTLWLDASLTFLVGSGGGYGGTDIFTLPTNCRVTGGGTIKVSSTTGSYRSIFSCGASTKFTQNVILDGITINANNQGNTYVGTDIALSGRLVFRSSFSTDNVGVRNCIIFDIDCENGVSLASISGGRVFFENCTVYGVGNPSGPAHDHSFVYTSAGASIVRNNRLTSTQPGLHDLATAFEIHGPNQLVTDNIASGWAKFGNVVDSNVGGQATGRWSNNIATDVASGIEFWSGSYGSYLPSGASSGDTSVVVNIGGGIAAGQYARIGNGTSVNEFVKLGTPSGTTWPVATQSGGGLANTYPADTAITPVLTVGAASVAGAMTITASHPTNINPNAASVKIGQPMLYGWGADQETIVVEEITVVAGIPTVILSKPLVNSHIAGEPIYPASGEWLGVQSFSLVDNDFSINASAWVGIVSSCNGVLFTGHVETHELRIARNTFRFVNNSPSLAASNAVLWLRQSLQTEYNATIEDNQILSAPGTALRMGDSKSTFSQLGIRRNHIRNASDQYGRYTYLLTSTATGGTFTLSWNGFTTSALAYNATAAQVQTALAALTGIGTVSTGGGDFPTSGIGVTMTTLHALTVDNSSLTGGVVAIQGTTSATAKSAIYSAASFVNSDVSDNLIVDNHTTHTITSAVNFSQAAGTVTINSRATRNSVNCLDGTILQPVVGNATTGCDWYIEHTTANYSSPAMVGYFTAGSQVNDQASGNIYIQTALPAGSTWKTAAAASGVLLAANNLSDVASAATARANLGVAGSSETALGPTGCISQTFARAMTNSRAAGTSTGTIWFAALHLLAGDVVSSLHGMVGSTGAGTPTHSWMCLANSSLNLVAISADKTTTALAADTVLNYPIANVSGGAASSYTVPTSGVYYVGFEVTASVAPTLVTYSTGIADAIGLAPVLSGKTGASLTAPSTFPTTYSSLLTGQTFIPYFWIT